MGAVKGYNVGGLNAIPIFGTKRIPRSVQPSAMNTLGTPFQDIDVKIQDEIPLAVQEKQKEEIEKTIEPNVETVSSINEKNKKLLKNENINFPEGKNLD